MMDGCQMMDTVMEYFVTPLVQGVRQRLGCQHHHAPMVEGKTWCPDCGEGLLFEWVVFKCACCDQKRPGQYFFGQPKPQTRHCQGCGSTEYHTLVMDNPEYFQLRFALLRKTPENQITLSLPKIHVVIPASVRHQLAGFYNGAQQASHALVLAS